MHGFCACVLASVHAWSGSLQTIHTHSSCYVSLTLGTFTTNPYGENGTVPYWLCTAQAAFSVFGTESSILWTIAVAVYLFVIAFSRWLTVSKLLVPVLHIACWGIPFIITVSLGATQLLGRLCSCPAFSVFADFSF